MIPLKHHCHCQRVSIVKDCIGRSEQQRRCRRLPGMVLFVSLVPVQETRNALHVTPSPTAAPNARRRTGADTSASVCPSWSRRLSTRAMGWLPQEILRWVNSSWSRRLVCPGERTQARRHSVSWTGWQLMTGVTSTISQGLLEEFYCNLFEILHLTKSNLFFKWNKYYLNGILKKSWRWWISWNMFRSVVNLQQ